MRMLRDSVAKVTRPKKAQKKKGLLHERPYRLATLATSPALAGEAKMP